MTPSEAQKICAIFLLTDGHVQYRKSRDRVILQFFGNNESLHQAFRGFMWLGFKRNPSFYCYFDKSKQVFATGYEFKKENPALQVLNSISPSYSTKGEPTMAFLFDEKKEVQTLAFRIAMATEGSIGISFRPSGGISPRLRLACTNPVLVRQWNAVAHNLGIEMKLDMDKASWSGIHGLCAYKKRSIIRFCDIGGFYPEEVKISRGKYKNLRKNLLLSKVRNWLITKNAALLHPPT